jgi:DNA polymerase elongation subunit (family B)
MPIEKNPEIKDQLRARENAIKIFVNAIYGLSGAQTFQLYDVRVASACTSVARQLTYFAREAVEDLEIGKVVFRDTDSCGVMLSKDAILDVKAKSNALNALVNKKLQDKHDTKHIVKFVLEEESFQEKTYYPKAKKAYARIECDVNDIIDGKPITRDLKIKGVSWSLMSTYGKDFFREHTEYILSNL